MNGLLAAAERHHGEQEVHHVATVLAAWSGQHARIWPTRPTHFDRHRQVSQPPSTSDPPHPRAMSSPGRSVSGGARSPETERRRASDRPAGPGLTAEVRQPHPGLDVVPAHERKKNSRHWPIT
ncbi:hypothetical protein C6N75_02240 [Streptomyces solincola]|uniref:Uncharacterized protein n=1 Tax=Streptomyces solincola TaxID=2100817 RepID=A0A2S9Q240_9ACTN|nr:hypothetical protein C6N75_02240 [Streptomyces solincola]